MSRPPAPLNKLMAGSSDTLRSPPASSEGRRRIMAKIRGRDTRPERLLRRALWSQGVRGWRCHWPGPGGRIDIALTRWKVAVLVDGAFWHGDPSKWQPGRWQGYWERKIKRNMAGERTQNTWLQARGGGGG